MAADPVAALRWRTRTSWWNHLRYSWRTGKLPLLMAIVGIYGAFLGYLNLSSRGNPAFTSSMGLEGVVLLEMMLGAMIGLASAVSVLSRRWDDLLLPIDWEPLVRARAKRAVPTAVGVSVALSVLLQAEIVPVGYPLASDLRLFCVLAWVALASVLTTHYLVLSLRIKLASLPRELAKKVDLAFGIVAIPGVILGWIVFALGLVSGWEGSTLVPAALSRAPVDLISGLSPGRFDIPGIVASFALPAALFGWVRTRPILLRLPDAVYLASEAGGALSPERPPKPGFWTNLRLRFRPHYRDSGAGSRATYGLMLTLALRAGLGILAIGLVGIFLPVGLLIAIDLHDLKLAAEFIGTLVAVVGVVFGAVLAFQVSLSGSPGGYSAARLLPFTGRELIGQHGRLVWPFEVAVSAAIGGVMYFQFGAPIGTLVFGTVLTVLLLAVWGTQAGMLSSTTRPHGRGVSTARLQFGVGLGFVFLLAPVEGMVAFSISAPTEVLLILALLGILGLNLLLVCGLTLLSIRSYPNPPRSGAGTGTPPRT